MVDVDDAEPLRVPPCPLEVVQERPDVVAGHGRAGRDRVVHGREVSAEVVDAVGVGDAAVVAHDVGESVSGRTQPRLSVSATCAAGDAGHRGC